MKVEIILNVIIGMTIYGIIKFWLGVCWASFVSSVKDSKLEK